MKSKNNLILYSIIFGAVFYLVDSLLFYIFFAVDDQTFMQILVTAVPYPQLYSRLVMLTAIIIFGLMASGIMSNLYLENDFLRSQTPSASSDTLDTSFISSISYQIRTPLNAIVGFSELLKDPNLPAQSKQTYIGHISSSGSYLLQFINNIVDISKIESNQLAVNKNEFDLHELLEGVLDQYNERKRELGKGAIGISLIKSKSESFNIITDRDRLRQVIINLLENAVKHTDEGSIEMGYKEKEAGTLEFFIKDTGRGFSMDRLDIILNRYRKLYDNHNQPFDGTALQLAISKSLLKLLGGEIWAESQIGKGSVFYFSLPYTSGDKQVAQVKVESPKRSAIIKPDQKNWQQYVILIAEDVESNFIYLQELLKPTNVELIWAQNGKEAVEHVKENRKIDLVLMDILMPVMDGYQAARQIKKLRDQLPIIAQTAYSIDSERDKEDLLNFDDYLIKPIWSPQLMSTLGKYLS